MVCQQDASHVLKAKEMFLIWQSTEHRLLDQLLLALKSMVNLWYFARL